jgi:hypothetical protein
MATSLLPIPSLLISNQRANRSSTWCLRLQAADCEAMMKSEWT